MLQTAQAEDLIEVKVQPHPHDFVCGKRLHRENAYVTKAASKRKGGSKRRGTPGQT
jgi:hypothetical protein